MKRSPLSPTIFNKLPSLEVRSFLNKSTKTRYRKPLINIQDETEQISFSPRCAGESLVHQSICKGRALTCLFLPSSRLVFQCSFCRETRFQRAPGQLLSSENGQRHVLFPTVDKSEQNERAKWINASRILAGKLLVYFAREKLVKRLKKTEETRNTFFVLLLSTFLHTHIYTYNAHLISNVHGMISIFTVDLRNISFGKHIQCNSYSSKRMRIKLILNKKKFNTIINKTQKRS